MKKRKKLHTYLLCDGAMNYVKNKIKREEKYACIFLWVEIVVLRFERGERCLYAARRDKRNVQQIYLSLLITDSCEL